MSRTYFVLNLPFHQTGGHMSHGMHVTTTGDAGSAIEVERRMGRRVIGALPCPDIFTCDHVERQVELVSAALAPKAGA